LVARLKTILKRDLKLGTDVQIGDTTPLFGGDMDLDSLDLPLLITSMEREFGIKIPSQNVGAKLFQNVTSLAGYIQEHAAKRTAAAATVAPPAPSDPLSRLPHREPFRFVSRLTAIQPGVSAQGVWAVGGSEAFFAGHFPGRPIVPGVLIIEALAQLSGVAGSGGESGQLAHADIRFEQPVAPPAEIQLRTTLMRVVGTLQQFDVEAAVASAIVARGSLALHRPGGQTS
jgi:3-hydroxyacyl-[acyl-carrier-protein] dehydratase